jgi:hypothetical protein
MERKPFQFTLRRLLLATVWFALAAAALRIHLDNVSPYEDRFTTLINCSPLLFPALGAGIGVLTGQFNRWAFIGFAIPVVGVLVILFGLLTLSLFSAW